MRKWHRWLSVVFGVAILFIAGTGVASHVVKIYADGGFGDGDDRMKPPKQMIADVTARPGGPAATAKPAPNPMRKWIGWLHHLHSGEEFGPVGIVISLLSGFALLFFAFSGLWMYIQMFRRRTRGTGKSSLFWD
jgi:hypothetical protein